MFLGAVVTLEGALPTPQEYEEEGGSHPQQDDSPHSTADGGPSTVLLLRDLTAPRWWVVREFWVGKDRWEGTVCQCSGGRRCFVQVLFFGGKMREGRQGRKSKGERKEPPLPPRAPHDGPPTPRNPERPL